MVKVAKTPKQMKGRGGKRNFAKPRTDIELLTDSLCNLVKMKGHESAFNFYEYAGLWVSCAIRHRALAQCAPILLALLKAEPSGALVYTDLKAAFTAVIHRVPDLVGKGEKHTSVQEKAGDLADRCLVLLNHGRLLASKDKEFQKAEELCEGHMFKDLQRVVAIIRSSSKAPPREDTQGATSSKPQQAASPDKLEHPMLAVEPFASQDSDGLPSLSFWTKRKGVTTDESKDEAEELAAELPKTLLAMKEPASSTTGKAASSITKKPASASVPHPEASTTKAVLKKPVRANVQELDELVDMTTLILKGPYPSGQTYLVHKKPPKLVTQCTAKQSLHHGKVIKKVLQQLRLTPNATKAMAVEIRNDILLELAG